jgi:hypothetical protein
MRCIAMYYEASRCLHCIALHYIAFSLRVYFYNKSPSSLTHYQQPLSSNYQGQLLDVETLNCSNDLEIAGKYTYDPDFNTVLPKGLHELTVTFTPEDVDNYEISIITASLKVLPMKIIGKRCGEREKINLCVC